MPRRHPYSSHVYKVKGSKVLTVKIYSRYIYIYIYIYIYTISKRNLPEQDAQGISG